MIIQPNSTVKILKAVPLDDTYEHTVMFGSAAAQQSALSALAKHTLTGLTYQRLVPGKCRVGIKAEDLYDCNYMMFQNTSFGTKWFYAFIKSVEYINNECSEITFDIDALQTWLFDCSPGTCYVDRCHTTSDGIGEHIEPEPVSPGEYVLNGYETESRLKSMSVVIAIVDTEGQTVAGNKYDGIYSGATLWGFDIDNVDGINAKLQEYIQQPDAIVGMYMVPSFAIHNADGEEVPNGGRQFSIANIGRPSSGTSLNGYVPRNNKLYTYPYCYLHVDNSIGQTLALRYEFFQTAPSLNVITKITSPVSCTLVPFQYKGTGSFTPFESLTLSGYPLCSWNYNAYQSWVSQNAIPLAINAIGGLAGAAITQAPAIAEGNPLGMAASVLSTATSAAAQWYKASIAADIGRGNLNNGGLNTAWNRNTFGWGMASGTKQFLAMCDSFFDRFGYHVGKIMTVNRSARTNWTYVRTIGVDMRGSVPADDMRVIANAYDKGITWWTSLGAVGNYGLSNRAGG